ncbi:MAG: GNAT family N-acetyltransferase [Aeromicrobium sp.]
MSIEDATTTTTVENNAARSRYEISVDGILAGFTEYVDQGDVLVFPHTEVFEEFGGLGLAAILVTQALDDVRANGRVIRPLCPYVAGFIAKHPEYQDLVA